MSRLMKPAALALAALATLCAAGETRAQDGQVTQTIDLVPGWNAVWLSVDPADRSPAAVFAGLDALEQVWCFFATNRTVEFVDHPASRDWNTANWSTYLPPSHPRAALSDLSSIQPCRGYLVKTTGAAALSITGRPAAKARPWKADSFNLIGFPIAAGGSPPKAGSFFYADEALRDAPKFKLNPTSAKWEPLLKSDDVRAGHAYWIRPEGATSFTGAISITTGAEGLDFGSVGERRRLVIRNNLPWPVPLTLANDDPSFPLLRKSSDEVGNPLWLPFGSLGGLSLPAERSLLIETGIDRSQIAGAGTVAGILTITSGPTEFKLPISASRSAESLGAGGYAGLWVGTATLNAVSEVNTPAADTVGPTTGSPAVLDLKLIVHVDSTGQARLLKSVIGMWQDGTLNADGSIDRPGRYVLVTDDTRIPDFKGATLRDGRPFGYRISSVAYDFEGDELPLDGFFGAAGNDLTTDIVIAKDSPTHPYRHKYHPDHDGLDPNYEVQPHGLTADREELWEITRSLTLTFGPAGTEPSPSAADSVYGTYAETVTGMHKHPITATGTFSLQRASDIPELNPAN